jgi:hypothetical protein
MSPSYIVVVLLVSVQTQIVWQARVMAYAVVSLGNFVASKMAEK